jgi:phosphohistidine phosphatase
MKTIILFRHAKSDWEAEHASDHERPLNRRGRKAARSMGLQLASMEQVPERVLTSSATRAQETARIAAEAGGWSSPIEVEPEFYESSPETVLRRVAVEDDRLSSLLLVGHEPVWSMLASALIGGGSLRFPTAAMARIDIDVEH